MNLCVLNLVVSVGTSVWWSFYVLLLENSIFWNVMYSGGNLVHFSHTSQWLRAGRWCSWYSDCATGWAVRGSKAGRGKRLFPVQNLQTGCGYRGSFLGVNQPGREDNNLPTSSSKVKNEWSYTSDLRTCLHGMDKENFTFTQWPSVKIPEDDILVTTVQTSDPSCLFKSWYLQLREPKVRLW
jgi:hypothetical protein